jgi:Icc-related predicted phosphoesterase
MEDLPHHGIKAFRWLLQVFKPAYHLHGHIHVYRNDIPTITQFEETQVINCYGYRELTLEAKINPNHRSVQAAEGGNNERFDQ